MAMTVTSVSVVMVAAFPVTLVMIPQRISETLARPVLELAQLVH